MHVRVVPGLVAIDRRDDTRGPLRRCGAVEEHERLVVHLAAQDREVAPDALGVIAAGLGQGAHGDTSRPSRDATADSRFTTARSMSSRSVAGATRETAVSMN